MKNKVVLILCAILLLFSGLAISENTESMANRSISLDADTYTVYVGKPLKMRATVNKLTSDAPVSTAIIWSSSDESVVTVSSTGSISGKAAGTATITAVAKDDDAIRASANIEVRIPVKSVSINEKNLVLLAGADEESAKASLTYTVVPEDAYYQTGSWSSTKEEVVSVDENGNITALSAGTATILFSSDDPNVAKKGQLQVKVNQAVTAISLSQGSVNIPIKKSASVKALVEPANAANKKVAWASDDESIATVSSTGQITGKNIGSTTIHAIALDGSNVSASVNVEVVQPITKIDITDKKLSLPPSEKWQLEYSILPDDATKKDVRWTSSNEKIATIDETGVITTVSGGKCNIIGTAADGSNVKATIALTVKKYDVVFTDNESKDVDFRTEDSMSYFIGMTNRGPANYYEEVKVTFKNGCVQSGGDHVLVPIKSGEDVVTVSINRNGAHRKWTYTVYVSESAFVETKSE